MPCQSATFKINAPKLGAKIGATPITSTIKLKARADCTGLSVSRMAARVTTVVTQAPSACKVLAINSAYSLLVVAQMIDAMIKMLMPKYNGRTRPIRSLNGP